MCTTRFCGLEGRVYPLDTLPPRYPTPPGYLTLWIPFPHISYPPNTLYTQDTLPPGYPTFGKEHEIRITYPPEQHESHETKEICCSQKFIHLLRLEGLTRSGGFILSRASSMLTSYFLDGTNDLP